MANFENGAFSEPLLLERLRLNRPQGHYLVSWGRNFFHTHRGWITCILQHEIWRHSRRHRVPCLGIVFGVIANPHPNVPVVLPHTRINCCAMKLKDSKNDTNTIQLRIIRASAFNVTWLACWKNQPVTFPMAIIVLLGDENVAISKNWSRDINKMYAGMRTCIRNESERPQFSSKY